MEEYIHLDNLVQFQERWLKGYADSAHSGIVGATAVSNTPQINSPRSLRACAMCNIDPSVTFEIPLLQQHLELVMADAAWVDLSVPKGISMREALDVCKMAGINMGSTQQKMQAYRNFTRHKAERLEKLTCVREVRRQLIAEEMFNRRKMAYVEKGLQRASVDSVTSPRYKAEDECNVLSCFDHNDMNTASFPPQTTVSATVQQWVPNTRVADTNLDDTEVLPIDGGLLGSSNPDIEIEADSPIDVMGAVCMSASSTSSRSNPVLEMNAYRLAVVAESENRDPHVMEVAPVAPPISMSEQGEVYYYYCANAVPAGYVSNYCRTITM